MKDGFRIELQVLFSKYASRYNLGEEECRVLPKLIETIVNDSKEVRGDFYRLMSKYAKKRVEDTQKESEKLLKSLKLSEEEEKILMAKVKIAVNSKDPTKVEN